MQADGSEPTNLTQHPVFDTDSVFSPDGRQIVSRTDRDGRWQLHVMNPGGSGQRNLSHGVADDIWFWLPPDRSTIYLALAAGSDLQHLEWSAAMIEVESGERQSFTFSGEVNWRRQSRLT